MSSCAACRTVSAILLLALVACRSDSVSSVDATTPSIDPLNDVIVSVVRSDYTFALPPVQLEALSETEFHPGSCLYSASTSRFECPAATYAGVTVTTSFALLDASGRALSSIDKTKTAAVKSNVSVAGTAKAQGYELAVEGSLERTLRGLLIGPRTLNGSSRFHFAGTWTVNGITSPFDATTTVTLADLVYASSAGWPLAGTVTIENVYAVGAGLSPITRRTTVIFSGTSTVAVSTVYDGVTRQCNFDLANPGTLECR
jgi:hypothetical protein